MEIRFLVGIAPVLTLPASVQPATISAGPAADKDVSLRAIHQRPFVNDRAWHHREPTGSWRGHGSARSRHLGYLPDHANTKTFANPPRSVNAEPSK